MNKEISNQLAENKNELTNQNAFDMLNRGMELSNKIKQEINDARLTPVLILGILETIKQDIHDSHLK